MNIVSRCSGRVCHSTYATRKHKTKTPSNVNFNFNSIPTAATVTKRSFSATLQKKDTSNQKIPRPSLRFGEAQSKQILELFLKHDFDKILNLIDQQKWNANALDQTGLSLLHHAVRMKNIPFAKELLERGADPLLHSETGSTHETSPFHDAIIVPSYPMTQLLLDRRDAPNYPVKLADYGKPLRPLILALQPHFFDKEHEEKDQIAVMLINRGADLFVPGHGYLGFFALQSRMYEAIKTMLEKHPEMASSFKNENGKTLADLIMKSIVPDLYIVRLALAKVTSGR